MNVWGCPKQDPSDFCVAPATLRNHLYTWQKYMSGNEPSETTNEKETPDAFEVQLIWFKLCIIGAATDSYQPLVVDPLQVPVFW